MKEFVSIEQFFNCIGGKYDLEFFVFDYLFFIFVYFDYMDIINVFLVLFDVELGEI